MYFVRYEAKRTEIEAWLQRMESRLDQMGKIATTVDILEAQQKEQKVSKIILCINYAFVKTKYLPIFLSLSMLNCINTSITLSCLTNSLKN